MNPSIGASRADRCDNSGVALLAVLWLVAALSIMLLGITHAIRAEVIIASDVRSREVNIGLADAAIRMTLQELIASKKLMVRSVQRSVVSVFGHDIGIEIVPMNGYIDLNNASLDLLSDTFEYGAGVTKADAQKFAASAIEYRGRVNGIGESMKFHAVEEMLQLPGINYSVYTRLKHSVTTDITGGGRVNPLASTSQTLGILARGNVDYANQVAEASIASPESVDTSKLTAAHIEMTPTGYLSVRAKVRNSSTSHLVRDWHVDVSSSAHGLPWRTIRAESIVIFDVVAVQ